MMLWARRGAGGDPAAGVGTSRVGRKKGVRVRGGSPRTECVFTHRIHPLPTPTAPPAYLAVKGGVAPDSQVVKTLKGVSGSVTMTRCVQPLHMTSDA
jgi:hypothetical protein